MSAPTKRKQLQLQNNLLLVLFFGGYPRLGENSPSVSFLKKNTDPVDLKNLAFRLSPTGSRQLQDPLTIVKNDTC